MSSTQTESRNDAKSSDAKDVREEIQELKKTMEVQAATEAGAHATQVATHAGTWSTMIAGSAGLVIGLFLGTALMTATRS